MKTLLIAAALAVAVTVPAHADGLLVQPPAYGPPVAYGPPPVLYSLPGPAFQGPPTKSCIEAAIDLAYLTGSRNVGNQAAAACQRYAPVNFPHADPRRYYGPPLGGYPPPDGR